MPPNLQFPADLVALTEEILNGKLHFLFSEILPLLPILLKLCYDLEPFFFESLGCFKDIGENTICLTGCVSVF